MWHSYSGLSGGRYRRYLSLREGSEQAPPGAALKARRRTYEMAAILGVGVVRLLRGIALIVSSSIKPIFSPNSHVNSTASLVVSAFQNSSSVSTESTGMDFKRSQV